MASEPFIAYNAFLDSSEKNLFSLIRLAADSKG